MKISAKPSVFAALLLTIVSVLFLSASSEAKTWYVKGGGNPNGHGDGERPFSSLQEVEQFSQPGDTIFVIPSKTALDGGIQLKEGQRLIGLGAPVALDKAQGAEALITNTSGARYDGDAIRLAPHSLVVNIHIDNAFRSSVLGINAVGAQVVENLMTNDMAVHDIFAIEGPAPSKCGQVTATPPTFQCVGEWPKGYILFAPQTNHFGAITLITCGTGSRSAVTNGDVRPEGYCKFLDAGAGSVAETGHLVIAGNVIRDSNSDGIMVINDFGVPADVTVAGNTVKNLSQPLPDPAAVGITDHVVRSRGFCIITIENSVTQLNMTHYTSSNLSPHGNFAADGIVFLTAGLNPVVNAVLRDLSISNPFLTGDTSNGDSIEIQHRGSTNGILNVDIARAHLSDPASTNIKLIESSNPDNGTYNVSIADSVMSNINTLGNEDAQIRYSGTERNATKAINLTLRNVSVSGLGRGIGLGSATNTNNVASLHVLVENCSFSDLTREAIFWAQASGKFLGTKGGAIIDLGGGPLGSVGNNRFVNDGQPGFIPAGVADPSGIDPVSIDGTLSFADPNTAAPLQVFASNDYWGGGAPVVSSTPGPATKVFIPAGSNVTFTSASFLTLDPQQ